MSFLNCFDFPFPFFNFQFQMFLAMSAAGTKFHGYFFAFHLLNIVNNNQLLSGVIKAVTLNGNPIIFQVVQYSRVSISGGCWFWLTLTVRKKVAELYAKFAPLPISYWFARFLNKKVLQNNWHTFQQPITVMIVHPILCPPKTISGIRGSFWLLLL